MVLEKVTGFRYLNFVATSEEPRPMSKDSKPAV